MSVQVTQTSSTRRGATGDGVDNSASSERSQTLGSHAPMSPVVGACDADTLISLPEIRVQTAALSSR
ncbi:hypothetical protein VZT92_016510 [Zoarces viviparus]|uniref:Uncharacterized protein n=1 Tax=Zoarces viviparus TaxID=48416 RepID=A0AAW1ETW6_ZOAVI